MAAADPLVIGEYLGLVVLGISGAWAARKLDKAAQASKERAEEARRRADEADIRAEAIESRAVDVVDKADDARQAAAVAGHLSHIAHKQSVEALTAAAQLEQLTRMYREANEFGRQQAEQHARELGRMEAMWADCERRHERATEILDGLRDEVREANRRIEANVAQIANLNSTIDELRQAETARTERETNSGGGIAPTAL